MMRNKTVSNLLEEQATSQQIVISELKEVITLLREDSKGKDKMIEKLWEKLMARDLPELATYGQQPELPDLDAKYDPFLDEDNAGEILDAIESNKTNS